MELNAQILVWVHIAGTALGNDLCLDISCHQIFSKFDRISSLTRVTLAGISCIIQLESDNLVPERYPQQARMRNIQNVSILNKVFRCLSVE